MFLSVAGTCGTKLKLYDGPVELDCWLLHILIGVGKLAGVDTLAGAGKLAGIGKLADIGILEEVGN